VTNTSTIVLGEVASKFLHLEVDEKIIIPRVIRGDVKDMFVREVDIDGGTGSIGGKCRNEFSEDDGFLSLGCRKFEVVFLKDDDPSRKISINLSEAEKVVHWVGIYNDFGS
jgi:hypothetical protein